MRQIQQMNKLKAAEKEHAAAQEAAARERAEAEEAARAAAAQALEEEKDRAASLLREELARMADERRAGEEQLANERTEAEAAAAAEHASQVAGLEGQLEDARGEICALTRKVEGLESEIEALRGDVRARDDAMVEEKELAARALADEQADLNTLRAAIGEETDADGSLWRDERHHAEVAGTVAHETEAGIGITSPVTSPPYETELPDGVAVIPDEDSLDFTEHYPETREGLPINNGEVPLDMWAPEIALSEQQR